jgi:hypothetical protein
LAWPREIGSVLAGRAVIARQSLRHLSDQGGAFPLIEKEAIIRCRPLRQQPTLADSGARQRNNFAAAIGRRP